jgi:hypothetical protein
MSTAIKTTKTNYREQMKCAKQIIKGINVLVEGGEEFRNLDRAIFAAEQLEIVSKNLQYFINTMKAGA